MQHQTATPTHQRPSAASRTQPLILSAGPALLRTSRLVAYRLKREDWLFLASLYGLTRVLIIFLGLLGTAMFPYLHLGTFHLDPPIAINKDLWLRLFQHFDGQWYIDISQGYPGPGSGNPQWLLHWAFFPLYPLAMHPVVLLLGALGVKDVGLAGTIAGVIISHTALFAALIYFYRLVAAELSASGARRAITYLLVFPAGIFFSAVYTESLFLLVTVAAFYHARRRQWAFAGLFSALALLTRAQGLFLLLPITLEFTADLAARRQAEGHTQPGRRWWDAHLWYALQALWLTLPLLALGGYALYSRAQTGYWLAFSTSATVFWGKRLTPPVYPLIRYVLAPDLGSALNFDFRSVNFAMAILFLGLVVVAWRRLPPIYSVWLLVCVLFPLSTNGHYFFSFTRYVSIAFPAFVALACWSLGQRWTPEGTTTAVVRPMSLELRDRLVVIPFLMLLALFTLMFVNGIYATI